MKVVFHTLCVIIVIVLSIMNLASLIVWASIMIQGGTTNTDDVDSNHDRDRKQDFGLYPQDKHYQNQKQPQQQPQQEQSILLINSSSIDTVDVGLPKVVWLMSFPNSGNSFTTQMVRMHTNHFTATNYGEEHIGENGTSVPIHNHPMYARGPFLSESNTKSRAMGRLILTKTHCGGRCSRCGPETYMETLESFKTACLTARRGISSSTKNGVLAFEKMQYHQDLVYGAIHIIRDPFDNIVSRFHLIQKVNKKQGKKNFENHFPNDALGFRKWCNYMDGQYLASEAKFLDNVTLDLLRNIPCHSDFYRYIQWHNLAFQVTDVMNIPAMIVHYEDYEHNFHETKDRILSFLDLKDVSYRNVTFSSGKTYGHYFTADEKRGVLNLLYHLSSAQTQKEVMRYFGLQLV